MGRHLSAIRSIFYIYPPVPSVRLGLDLQGGSHIVLRARNQAVLNYSFGSKLAPTDCTGCHTGIKEILDDVKKLLN